MGTALLSRKKADDETSVSSVPRPNPRGMALSALLLCIIIGNAINEMRFVLARNSRSVSVEEVLSLAVIYLAAAVCIASLLVVPRVVIRTLCVLVYGVFAILCVGFISRAYSIGELALNYILPVLIVNPLIVANMMGFDSRVAILLPYRPPPRRSVSSAATPTSSTFEA